MQFETVSTGPEPVTATNPQDTQKNGWTCVNWYNTVFEIAARKTSRIFGHVVAGFVSIFTFIPSLTVDLTYAALNLYDRKISRPQAPLENQVSTAVLPASVSSDISVHSLQSSVELTPDQKKVPSCDLSTSTTTGLSGQLSETTRVTKTLPPSVTKQKPLADLQRYPLQPTLTKEAEKVALPKNVPAYLSNCCFLEIITKRFEFKAHILKLYCEKPGCSHLFIPEVIGLVHNLIEPGLPIIINSFDNMQLYCSQTGLFDKAVRDITSDLLDGGIHRKRADVKYFVRYDNLPPYKVSIDGMEQDRSGLIDPEKMGATQYGKALGSIAGIFPYHYDIIKEEADRRAIPYDDEILKAAVADGTKYLAAGYEDHCKWLQEKGVLDTFEDFNLGLSQERMNDVKEAVAKELNSMNKGEILIENFDYRVRSPEGFLKNGATSAKILSDRITEKVIENLTQEINRNFRQNIQNKNPAQWVKSNLVQTGGLLAEYDHIIHGVSEYFQPSDHYEERLDNKTCFTEALYDYMIGRLVAVIFDELVNGREMLFYSATHKPIAPLNGSQLYYERSGPLIWTLRSRPIEHP